MMDINAARAQIDQIDREITQLFCQRMACSAAIGAYKVERGLPIHVPAREEEILTKLTQMAPEELRDSVQKLYRQIFAISRDYQQALIRKDGIHD